MFVEHTSITLRVKLKSVGSALVPTYASPSTDNCSYLTSILGISMLTL